MPKKVIVSVLDWGLGHATRMFELIQYFIDNNWHVTIASSGDAAIVLQQKFPTTDFNSLPSYNFEYSYTSMVRNVVSQLPKISKVIKEENLVLNSIIEEISPNLIVSDNRYGIYSSKIPSVFISHQLRIQPPLNLSFTQPILWKLHEKFLSKFDQIWVPDYGGDENISGDLSHNIDTSLNIKYIGPLSRFKSAIPIDEVSNKELPNILALLSGPEPSRTELEELLTYQLEKYGGKSVLLRGKPGDLHRTESSKIQIYNHLNDDEFEKEFNAADIIIVRSGYSSIMDIFRLKKKAVFIPTPGQTEQEYLAEKLMNEQRFFYMAQEEFDLNTALNKYSEYTGFDHNMESITDSLNNELDELLKRLLKQ